MKHSATFQLRLVGVSVLVLGQQAGRLGRQEEEKAQRSITDRMVNWDVAAAVELL